MDTKERLLSIDYNNTNITLNKCIEFIAHIRLHHKQELLKECGNYDALESNKTVIIFIDGSWIIMEHPYYKFKKHVVCMFSTGDITYLRGIDDIFYNSMKNYITEEIVKHRSMAEEYNGSN